MAQLAGSLVNYPARMLLFWYSGGLVLGTTLLLLPTSCADPHRSISFLDALFTATSALCVTGLTVRNTASDFSIFGQVCILCLIQTGGVGIMTLTTFLVTQITGTSLRHRAVIVETLGANPRHDLRWIIFGVLAWTFSIELIGAICLFGRFVLEYPAGEAAWHAIFHSISAFCNAGFSLNSTCLMAYQNDIVVNFVVAGLIVSGGLGFPVLNELLKASRRPRHERWEGINLHSKITLIGTVIAILTGGIAVAVFEWNRTLHEMDYGTRVMASLFHSISCRTAGFNTVDLAEMSTATLFVSILFMAVGAGSCSTAGGIKVSTISILAIFAISRFRGKKNTNLFRRTIPQTTVDRAAVTVLLYIMVVGVGLTALVVSDPGLEARESNRAFLECMFETVSALSTVGLSTGITHELSEIGRCILIVLMFFGRLGPITIFAALAQHQDLNKIEYASEEPLIG
jgi:trk system potassium uptake protein TrkH